LSDDQIRCWGSNAYGTLGIESINQIGDAAVEMGDNLGIADVW
jgi:hypothetical protein